VSILHDRINLERFSIRKAVPAGVISDCRNGVDRLNWSGSASLAGFPSGSPDPKGTLPTTIIILRA